jgi:bifunctional non-homologous end joining protein LigD
MRVSNPDRLVDASSDLTKIDIVRHYETVGKLMMPHLKGRAVSLVRAPGGIGGELFFQKHASTEKLDGIDSLDPALSPGHGPLITVSRAAGLMAAAQWNVIEFHTQNADAADHLHPNRIVFDLDPGEGVGWAQVREAAELTRAFLVELGLAPFLKTSGGKGLHVVVPLRRQHDWDSAKGFSQAVVTHMSRAIPQRFVAKSGPKNRVGKIFIDYLRNGAGATTVCAWSARARPGMGVSVPVEWSELPTLRGGDHWTVTTVHERLAVGNTPWQSYARSARGLAAAIKKLKDAA